MNCRYFGSHFYFYFILLYILTLRLIIAELILVTFTITPVGRSTFTIGVAVVVIAVVKIQHHCVRHLDSLGQKTISFSLCLTLKVCATIYSYFPSFSFIVLVYFVVFNFVVSLILTLLALCVCLEQSI